MTAPHAPHTLDAGEQPCVMRKSHNPTPVRTQSHHRFPEYLQKRLWGEVRLQERLALCGTDHDSTHTWVGVLLGEQAQPSLSPGTLVIAEAEKVVAWFRAEEAKMKRPFGSGAFGVGSQGLANPDEQWDGLE